MPPVLDTHIHLFRQQDIPNLAWQTPSGPLYAPHALEQYTSIDTDILGFIFVETDRKYTDPRTPEEDNACWEHVLGEYAYGLDVAKETNSMRGMVVWAPLHLGFEALRRYEMLLEETGGKEKRLIVGYRYLLQDKPLETMRSRGFIQGLKWIQEQGKVFDLGIDVRGVGMSQMEEAVEMLKLVDGLKVVINHLTKPPLGTDPSGRWLHLLSQMAASPTCYMKLSGVFSELPPLETFDATEVVGLVKPWARTVFRLFGPKRVVWGSDWPVCGIGYKRITGDNKAAWKAWRAVSETLVEEVVEELVAEGNGRKEDWEGVWSENAIVAYGLKL